MARLTQIVDLSQLISLQQRLTNSLGMSVVFEEPDTELLNVIGQRGSVCKVCTEFINTREIGRIKCLESDSKAARDAQSSLKKASPDDVIVEFYMCNGKFRNFVIPISIGGEVLGNIFCGQFLVKTPMRTSQQYKETEDRAKRLGLTHEQVLDFTKLPEEQEIPQIAIENSIPNDQLIDFEKTYKEILNEAKPLNYVIDAVYLLSEIARTISSLGNAYYYSDIYNKLTRIVPSQLRGGSVHYLEEIGELVQMIRTEPSVDFSKEIKKANELIYETLLTVYEYEEQYIQELLLPYTSTLTSTSPDVSMLQNKLLIAHVRYDTRIVRTELNKYLREKVLNPATFTPNQSDLLDRLNSDTGEVENWLKESVKIKNNPNLELNRCQDISPAIVSVRDKLVGEFDILTHKPGLDTIESLVDILTNTDFGIQGIKQELCNERVLKHLPKCFAELRQQIKLRYDTVYFNWGSISPSLDSAIEEANLWASQFDQHGPVSLFSEDRLEQQKNIENIFSSIRGTVASLIKCQPDEIILTNNTTDGIRGALSSVDFSPKGSDKADRILVTNCEHDTVLYSIRQLENKFNIECEEINLFDDYSYSGIANEIVSKSRDGKTRVVILSHVTYNTGQLLDIHHIIEAVRRSLGDRTPFFLVDGAQAVGNIPVNISELDCDFYAADAHKWLMGQKGSGFLYVRASYLDERAKYFEFHENYMVADIYKPKNEETGRLYEPATMNIEKYVVMKHAVDKILSTNNTICERIQELSNRFRESIKSELESYGIRLINEESTTGLVTIVFNGSHSFELYDEIRKSLDQRYHVIVRALSNPPSLRFCISYLNSEWEVEYAIKALDNILQEIPIFAEKKAKIEEATQILHLRKMRVKKLIEETIEQALKAWSSKQQKAYDTITDVILISRSREIFEETAKRLENRRIELLGQAENSTSIEQLQELGDIIGEEINKLLIE